MWRTNKPELQKAPTVFHPTRALETVYVLNREEIEYSPAGEGWFYTVEYLDDHRAIIHTYDEDGIFIESFGTF